MALDGVATFPTSVWDGDSGWRDSDNGNQSSPDWQDWIRATEEVAAMQTRVNSNAKGVDDDALDSVGTLETVSGLTAVEKGDGAIHKTILTLAEVELTSVDHTTDGAQATKKLYTFPQGQIVILGAHQIYPLGSIAAVTGGAAGYSDTSDFSIGVGSTEVPAGVDLATTEQNMCAKADVDLTSGTSDAIESGINAALVPLDGSTTAIPVWLNTSTLDDGDHGPLPDTLKVSGTITLVWTIIGND